MTLAAPQMSAFSSGRLRDSKLRDEATRAAKSACLKIAGGAGGVTRPDKARAFAIARGEAVAAVEIATMMGDADPNDMKRCISIAERLVALLTGLIR